MLSFLAHLMLFSTIALLVISIEMTIAVNDISGAYTIGATGQLIPFVIGVASLPDLLRQLAFARARAVSFLQSHNEISTSQGEIDFDLCLEPR